MAAATSIHGRFMLYCDRCHAIVQMVVDYSFVEQTYREKCCMIANNTIHNSPIFSTH